MIYCYMGKGLIKQKVWGRGCCLQPAMKSRQLVALKAVGGAVIDINPKPSLI